MKTDLFQSCVHCWVFQICWHIECSTFTPSSFRIWNSWTGIPSPPLALFAVMLPQAHLTSHSRMSDSSWVITPSWISGSWRSFFVCVKIFFVQFCVFLPPLLNILCFCQVHTTSLLYWAHLCTKCSLGISSFLEEIFSLSHSIVFLYFLHWSLRKAFLSLLAILWSSAFKWVYLSFSLYPRYFLTDVRNAYFSLKVILLWQRLKLSNKCSFPRYDIFSHLVRWLCLHSHHMVTLIKFYILVLKTLLMEQILPWTSVVISVTPVIIIKILL